MTARTPLRALVVASVSVCLATTAARVAPPQADPVASLAEALVETAALPSLSIAILRDGEIVYANAWGFADLETGTPATIETRYRCASVSKVVTATALGRLMQTGQLDVDAPLVSYVPEWPSEPTITARQLAGHLAGVGHYHGADLIERDRHYDSVREALTGFRDSPRAGLPGAEYVYSTHGFTLLSAAIETAAGAPFLQALEQEVFDPLDMPSSGPDLRATPSPQMSTLYGRRGGQPWLIPSPENPSYKWAGGGLISTPSDLVRLAGGYLDGFVAPDVVEEMWTSQRTADGEETGVGIVWRIEEDDSGERIIHHSGAMGGARSTIAIFPDRGEAIAVMTNVAWNSDIHTTAKWLIEAYRNDGGDPGSIDTGGPVTTQGTFGETEEAGTLALTEGSGWITTPAGVTELGERLGTQEVERMPIRHLAGSRYLLITPFGIADLEIDMRDGRIHGRGQLFGQDWTFEGS